MNDFNLTWQEARNRLYSGTASIIRYVPNQGCCNSFIFDEERGSITRVYDTAGDLEHNSEPGNTLKKFMVMP